MAHYMIKSTIAELKALCVEYYDSEQFAWLPAWEEKGADMFVAHFAEGQANISGPIVIGNPNEPWFEVTGSAEVIARLDAIDEPLKTMREHMGTNGPMRAAYRSKGRSVIRNGNGVAVGPMPRFAICGKPPAQSYLDGADLEDLQELPDLE